MASAPAGSSIGQSGSVAARNTALATSCAVVTAPPEAWRAAPAPVGAIVFPSYDARAEPVMRRLSLLETVERLFGGRMWLGQRLTRERTEAFIRWLEPIPAFAISYAELEEAEGFVRSIVG